MIFDPWLRVAIFTFCGSSFSFCRLFYFFEVLLRGELPKFRGMVPIRQCPPRFSGFVFYKDDKLSYPVHLVPVQGLQASGRPEKCPEPLQCELDLPEMVAQSV